MTAEPEKLLADWCLEEHRPCVLYMDRMTVFQIASLMQLAMRHPHLPEHIRALSLQGDDRRLDVPPISLT